jgi:3-hydroxyisobutyrate dehydrogenase-like beta-hydroxyacid dehydrogenase
MTPATVTVLGDGRMGRAYRARLAACGWTIAPSGAGTVAVLALHDGADSRRAVAALDPRRTTHVLDLTTASVADVGACFEACARRGIAYVGGGITGGASEARAGTATLLLGPAPLPAALLAVVDALGPHLAFASAEQACGAKLLHNLAVVLQNHALAFVVTCAARLGIPDVETVLDRGTAGRRPSAASAVRDHRAGASSSYAARLVAKDLGVIAASFPEIARLPGFRLDELRALYAADGDVPYTTTALAAAARALDASRGVA